MSIKKHPILFLTHANQSIDYTSKQTARDSNEYPERNTTEHGELLVHKFSEIWKESKIFKSRRIAKSLNTKNGHYIEIKGLPEFSLKQKSIENISKGIRLLNVRITNEHESIVTVYVPEGKEGYFIGKIKEYLGEPKREGQRRLNNQDLVNSIEDISHAFIESFWRDDPDSIPGSDPIWCEIWLRNDYKSEVEKSFGSICKNLNIELKNGTIKFPERIVFMGKCSNSQLSELIQQFDFLAELRKAKTAISFLMKENAFDQYEWAKELNQRIELEENIETSICILDTGINNGHVLLERVLVDENKHSFDVTWGLDDHKGHGTQMAGVAIFGDLFAKLETSESIQISHLLESGKILPPTGENNPEFYGFITKQTISLAEIKNPNWRRVICMAVSVETEFDQGRPTSYSGAIDSLCSGAEDGQKRLILLSSGNTTASLWSAYPSANLAVSVNSPGQSWNALTVGACTHKVHIQEEKLAEFNAIAPSGGLSPFSSTSRTWEDTKWPFKPDIVLEGGNVAIDKEKNFTTECDDLSVLTTHYKPTERHFNSFSMSSAATAKAAWMAAQIQSSYPNAWPETIRALLIHSARWTQTMKDQFSIEGSSKANYRHLLRICGYGVPNLDRALYSMSNNLTLVAQETIQPFHKENGKSNVSAKEMHLYNLPWPKESLLALGETEVTLRVTLSYFIEPGPGEIGWKDRYRYRSYGLKFGLNRPDESEEVFRKRVNAAEEDAKEVGGSGLKWEIGSQTRNLGSVHSDFVKMTAVELAACKFVGIFPIIGWWKERTHLNKYSSSTRYSLIISIESPIEEIDIHTPVATQLKIPITVIS